MGPSEGAREQQEGKADDERSVEFYGCQYHHGCEGDSCQGSDVFVAFDPFGCRWAEGIVDFDDPTSHGPSCQQAIPEGSQGTYMPVEERPIGGGCDEAASTATASSRGYGGWGQTLILNFSSFYDIKWRRQAGKYLTFRRSNRTWHGSPG